MLTHCYRIFPFSWQNASKKSCVDYFILGKVLAEKAAAIVFVAYY